MRLKNTIKIGILSLCAIVFFGFAKPVPQLPLTLTVTSDKKIYQKNEPIAFEFVFKNASGTELKLFHPQDIYLPWNYFDLRAYVLKPNGKTVILKTPYFFAMTPPLRQEHYISLAPKQTLNLFLKFGQAIPRDFPIKQRIEGRGPYYFQYDRWNALMDIPPGQEGRLPDLIKKDLGFYGRIYFLLEDGKNYLATDDIVPNVFDIPGNYEIRFTYYNDNNTIIGPDERGRLTRSIAVTGAWTGKIEKSITITVR